MLLLTPAASYSSHSCVIVLPTTYLAYLLQGHSAYYFPTFCTLTSLPVSWLHLCRPRASKPDTRSASGNHSSHPLPFPSLTPLSLSSLLPFPSAYLPSFYSLPTAPFLTCPLSPHSRPTLTLQRCLLPSYNAIQATLHLTAST